LQDSEESESFICPAERLAVKKLVRKSRQDPHNRLPYQDGIQSAVEHKHFMYKAFRGKTKSNAHLNVVRHNTKQNLPTVMSQYDSRNTKMRRYTSANSTRQTHYLRTAASGVGIGLSHTCGGTTA
jgi:hypothetical protein